jgi:hypothetical protein
MLELLVETKKEYTKYMIDFLTIPIYKGFSAMYDELYKELSSKSIENHIPDNILEIFQHYLSKIPKWDNNMINNHIKLIKTNLLEQNIDIDLTKLFKVLIKSHIIILSYNPTLKIQLAINEDIYKSITFEKFIHAIYIECARKFYNNPYLLYHDYSPLDIKRNQRESLELIEKSICIAIRKTIAFNHVIQTYLKEDIVLPNEDIQLNNNINKKENEIINTMIDKNLSDAELSMPTKILKIIENNQPPALTYNKPIEQSNNNLQSSNLQSNNLQSNINNNLQSNNLQSNLQSNNLDNKFIKIEKNTSTEKVNTIGETSLTKTKDDSDDENDYRDTNIAESYGNNKNNNKNNSVFINKKPNTDSSIFDKYKKFSHQN